MESESKRYEPIYPLIISQIAGSGRILVLLVSHQSMRTTLNSSLTENNRKPPWYLSLELRGNKQFIDKESRGES